MVGSISSFAQPLANSYLSDKRARDPVDEVAKEAIKAGGEAVAPSTLLSLHLQDSPTWFCIGRTPDESGIGYRYTYQLKYNINELHDVGNLVDLAMVQAAVFPAVEPGLLALIEAINPFLLDGKKEAFFLGDINRFSYLTSRHQRLLYYRRQHPFDFSSAAFLEQVHRATGGMDRTMLAQRLANVSDGAACDRVLRELYTERCRKEEPERRSIELREDYEVVRQMGYYLQLQGDDILVDDILATVPDAAALMHRWALYRLRNVVRQMGYDLQLQGDDILVTVPDAAALQHRWEQYRLRNPDRPELQFVEMTDRADDLSFISSYLIRRRDVVIESGFERLHDSLVHALQTIISADSDPEYHEKRETFRQQWRQVLLELNEAMDSINARLAAGTVSDLETIARLKRDKRGIQQLVTLLSIKIDLVQSWLNGELATLKENGDLAEELVDIFWHSYFAARYGEEMWEKDALSHLLWQIRTKNLSLP